MGWKIRQYRKGRAHKAKQAADRRVSGRNPSTDQDGLLELTHMLDPHEQKGHADAEGSRSQSDRRSWRPMPPLPFRDHNGIVITHDRRRLPERRLANIEVEWYL